MQSIVDLWFACQKHELYFPGLELSSNQCRLQRFAPSPCTWFPFQPSLVRRIPLKCLSVHLWYEFVVPFYYVAKIPWSKRLKAQLTGLLVVEFVTRGWMRDPGDIQQGNFIGCPRQCLEWAAWDGSDDHFIWVLSIFSIEKYWVLPCERMWEGCSDRALWTCAVQWQWLT